MPCKLYFVQVLNHCYVDLDPTVLSIHHLNFSSRKDQHEKKSDKSDKDDKDKEAKKKVKKK